MFFFIAMSIKEYSPTHVGDRKLSSNKDEREGGRGSVQQKLCIEYLQKTFSEGRESVKNESGCHRQWASKNGKKVWNFFDAMGRGAFGGSISPDVSYSKCAMIFSIQLHNLKTMRLCKSFHDKMVIKTVSNCPFEAIYALSWEISYWK